MARRMRLVELGAKRGQLNEPAPDATRLDELENRIVTEIEAEKRRAFDEATSHLRAVRERVAALQLDGLIARVGVTTDAAVANLGRAVISGRDRLYALKTAAVEHQAALRRFRDQHGLRRPARYPQSRLLHVGVIAALVLIESVANAFLIAIGHEQGLLGGFVNAITISAVNVGGGVAAGLIVVRNLGHRSKVRKVLAGLGFAGYGAFVVAFNLLVAHYRDAFESGSGQTAATLAVQRFRNAPLNLENLNGWVLFVMGCSFALIAAYDGFRIDDPYPGYGRLARLADEAKRDYVDEKEQTLEDVTTIRDAAVRAADDTLGEIELRRTQHDSIVAQQRKLVDSYGQHLRYLEQCANELLSIYRDANRASRSEKPPQYWTRHFSLDRPQLPFEVVIDDPAAIAALREKLVQILDAHRERLRTEYQAALSAFELVEQLDEGASARAGAG